MFGINVKVLEEYIIGKEMLDILTYGKLRGQYGKRGNYLTDKHLWTQQMEDQWNKVFGDNVKDKSTMMVYVSMIIELTLKYTPVDTGHLISTLYIKDYTNKDGERATEIGFDCDYAKYVHEIGFFYHEPPTRYKFLETAALETAERFGLIYSLSMSYSPLRLFINDSNKGENIQTIQSRKKYLEENKLDVYKRFIKEFERYEQEPTDENMPEISALVFGRYMKYWREHSSRIQVLPEDIASAFITDRARHNYEKDWVNRDFNTWLIDQNNDDSFTGLMKDWRRYLM